MLQKKPITQYQAREITKELLKGKREEVKTVSDNLTKHLIGISKEKLPFSIQKNSESDVYEKYLHKSSTIILKTSDDKNKLTYSLSWNNDQFYTKNDSSVVIVSIETIKEVEKMERKVQKLQDTIRTLDEQIYSLLLRLRTAKKIVEQFPEVAGLLEEKGTSTELTNVDEYRNLLGLPELPKNE